MCFLLMVRLKYEVPFYFLLANKEKSRLDSPEILFHRPDLAVGMFRKLQQLYLLGACLFAVYRS